jgi:hypothetical protein
VLLFGLPRFTLWELPIVEVVEELGVRSIPGCDRHRSLARSPQLNNMHCPPAIGQDKDHPCSTKPDAAKSPNCVSLRSFVYPIAIAAAAPPKQAKAAAPHHLSSLHLFPTPLRHPHMQHRLATLSNNLL